MFAITLTFDRQLQYLDLTNDRWYNYYHYGCLRVNRKTLEEYIDRKRILMNAAVVDSNDMHEYHIGRRVEQNKDKIALYFQLLQSTIVEIQDYDKKWDFTFTEARNKFWSRRDRANHCKVCGITIPVGILFAKHSEQADEVVCPFCIRDAHQQAVEEINNIPKDVLERVEAIRAEQLLIKNL